MKKIFSIIILAAIIQLIPIPGISQNDVMFFKAAGSPENPKVQVSWNKYNTYKGVVDICTRLAKAYPDLVTMESAGKSFLFRSQLQRPGPYR